MREYRGEKFLTDDDLKVSILGFSPRVDIKNPELRQYFQDNFGRDFLGGDELIAYAQSLVSGEVNFDRLEEKILSDIKNSGKSLNEILFNKTSTGIGRGHSLGGLVSITLGINGTKMLDSGLTGFVMSRSLTTSSRRRETTTEEIAIPNVLFHREDLLDEYLQISKDVFKEAAGFKEKFGNLKGIETFNKIMPYNGPCDLFITMPLDTLASLAFEVRQDELNYAERFVPRELHCLAGKLEELTEKTGMGIMYKQRIQVPRDTYLHYTVFKNPDFNLALELGEMNGMLTEPLVSASKNFTYSFKERLKGLKGEFESAEFICNPKSIAETAMKNMLALRSFVNEYNDALRVRVVDSLSWRVWSEQKRHATLKQNVESIYSAADRAYDEIKPLWQSVKEAYEKGDVSRGIDLSSFKDIISIDERLKAQPELVLPYLYHTARQLMFYGKMLNNGFEKRDALYIVPRNIKLRTTETYDLINLIDLELPLRLCSSCEPERYATSWKKREAIARAVPEIAYFLQPKCRIGFCTEGKPCRHIIDMRQYNNELHKRVNQEMLERAK